MANASASGIFAAAAPAATAEDKQKAKRIQLKNSDTVGAKAFDPWGISILDNVDSRYTESERSPLSAVTPDLELLKLKCYSNRALCLLKVHDHETAFADCCSALAHPGVFDHAKLRVKIQCFGRLPDLSINFGIDFLFCSNAIPQGIYFV